AARKLPRHPRSQRGVPLPRAPTLTLATRAVRRQPDSMPTRTRPPGPSYWTPFGAARELRPDPLAYVTRLQREYGDVALLRMGHLSAYFFFHPDAVRHVLQENHSNYVKGPLIAR